MEVRNSRICEQKQSRYDVQAKKPLRVGDEEKARFDTGHVESSLRAKRAIILSGLKPGTNKAKLSDANRKTGGPRRCIPFVSVISCSIPPRMYKSIE
jgi:hypothetical protein